MSMIRLRRLSRVCMLGLICAASAVAQDVVTKFDVPPMPLKTPPPVITRDLKGKAGLVTAVGVIDEDGKVASVTVAKATDPLLEAPTIQALERWRFKPAEAAGQPVRAKIMIPVRFDS